MEFLHKLLVAQVLHVLVTPLHSCERDLPVKWRDLEMASKRKPASATLELLKPGRHCLQAYVYDLDTPATTACFMGAALRLRPVEFRVEPQFLGCSLWVHRQKRDLHLSCRPVSGTRCSEVDEGIAHIALAAEVNR